MTAMTFAYVGLGANVGFPPRQVLAAGRLLARIPQTRLAAFSPLYAGAAVGCPGRQRDYTNAAAVLQTNLPPRRLQLRLQMTEKTIQRRPRRKRAPRRLDVDYLAHGAAGAARVCRRRLFLPHPCLLRRAFVLRPLADIVSPLPGEWRRALEGLQKTKTAKELQKL